MAAGIATFREVLTPEGYAHIDKIGDVLVEGYKQIVKKTGIEGYVESAGSNGALLFYAKKIRNYREWLDGGHRPVEALLVRHGQPWRDAAAVSGGTSSGRSPSRIRWRTSIVTSRHLKKWRQPLRRRSRRARRRWSLSPERRQPLAKISSGRQSHSGPQARPGARRPDSAVHCCGREPQHGAAHLRLRTDHPLAVDRRLALLLLAARSRRHRALTEVARRRRHLSLGEAQLRRATRLLRRMVLLALECLLPAHRRAVLHRRRPLCLRSAHPDARAQSVLHLQPGHRHPPLSAGAQHSRALARQVDQQPRRRGHNRRSGGGHPAGRAHAASPRQRPAPRRSARAVHDWRLFAVFGTICYSLVGLDLASIMGDEIREPKRNLPVAIFWGGLAAAIIYLGTTTRHADRRAARRRSASSPAFCRPSM